MDKIQVVHYNFATKATKVYTVNNKTLDTLLGSGVVPYIIPMLLDTAVTKIDVETVTDRYYITKVK